MAAVSEQENLAQTRRERDRSRSDDAFRYQSFVKNSIDGAWRLDLDEPIALDLPVMEQVELLYRGAYFGDANQALAEQYGFDTPAAVIGFRLEEFLPREEPASVPMLVQAAEAGYRLNNLQSVERDRFGNRKVFLNNVIGEIEDGYLLRIWGTASDITLRKQMEGELRLRSEVFEQFQEGCVIVEAGSEKITYVNAAFTQMTGYSESELPGNKLSFLQGSDTDPGTVAQIRECISRAQACSFEILNYKKDGTPFWNLMRISPVRDSSGRLTHFAGIHADITEQKRSREHQRQQRDQLAHLARVTTMGELTGALAHELSQPLTAVLSNAQAALRFLEREDCDLDEVREILKDIVADDKRAGQIMHRMRRLLKREECEHVYVDVNAVVKDVYALLRSELVSRQVRLDTGLADNLPAVQGDTVQLQQVMLNLIMNACHAVQDCEPDSRLIEVSTEENNGSVVEITIKDSGNGIGEDHMERIFEPFFTTKCKGLGMGLAINRTIIELHKGCLWAEDSVDAGAVFHVTLPVAS